LPFGDGDEMGYNNTVVLSGVLDLGLGANLFIIIKSVKI